MIDLSVVKKDFADVHEEYIELLQTKELQLVYIASQLQDEIEAEEILKQ